VAAQVQPGRAAAALERAEGGHEPGRPASAVGGGVRGVRAVAAREAGGDPRDHVPLAGAGPFRDRGLRRVGGAGPGVHPELESVAGSEDPAEDDSGGDRGAGGVLRRLVARGRPAVRRRGTAALRAAGGGRARLELRGAAGGWSGVPAEVGGWGGVGSACEGRCGGWGGGGGRVGARGGGGGPACPRGGDGRVARGGGRPAAVRSAGGGGLRPLRDRPG